MDKQAKQLILVGVIASIIVAIIGAAGTTFGIPRPAPYTMPSQGMEPTVALYSRLWINRNAYRSSARVRRGDIVVFLQPKAQTQSFRRIIGIPGDTVRMQGTSLWINGQPLNHTFVKKTLDGTIYSEGHYQVFYFSQPLDPTAHSLMTVTVPPEHFFVLGDHRDDTLDSRILGCIPFALIQGRAMGR